MQPPPLSWPTSATKPKLALSPFSLHHFGTWQLRWIELFFFACHPATLRAKTGLKLVAGMERQKLLSFSTLSLVWVPSTCRHSQYPCPKFDIAALLYNIYNANILKQRSIGATLEMHLFPAKVCAKYAKYANYAPGPTEPPRMPNFKKIPWFRYNIKYLVFRWGIGGFKLGDHSLFNKLALFGVTLLAWGRSASFMNTGRTHKC